MTKSRLSHLTNRQLSPAFEKAHLEVMDRLKLTDADEAIQRAFGE
jgi:hypothetical protein